MYTNTIRFFFLIVGGLYSVTALQIWYQVRLCLSVFLSLGLSPYTLPTHKRAPRALTRKQTSLFIRSAHEHATYLVRGRLHTHHRTKS